jgi:glutamate carboxypeptidase
MTVSSSFANSFSTREILDDVMRWAAIESPSVTPAAVARMFDAAEAEFRAAGAAVERTVVASGAPVLQARFAGQRDAPGILVLGHLDTVHPVGTIDGPLRLRIEGDRLYGPGVLDMKGGICLALYAVKRWRAETGDGGLPVTFLLIPDEELGSPATRALIEAQARRHRCVLVPEPAREGKVITGRHAFARYRLTTRGVPAHAGADNRAGRSAIRAMARLVETIESATDMDRLVSFSVGVIQGGLFVNVVPTECSAEVLCVASSGENLAFVHDFMAGLVSPIEGVTLDVERGVERPLFEPNPGTMQLFAHAAASAAELGVALEHGTFGGGSDGNFTGALGIATLDGLGAVGGGVHTHDEHLLISQLVPRARLFAGLLSAVAGNDRA